MPYLDPSLETSEVEAAASIISALQAFLPGANYEEGHVEVALAEAFGILAATVNTRLLEETRNDYAGFGTNVLGLYRVPAGIATCGVQISVDTNAGVTIPAGFLFTLSDADGQGHDFATTEDAVILPGDTMVFQVPAAALEVGPTENGLSGVTTDHDDVLHVTAVAVMNPSSGGADEETVEEYNARVVDRAQRFRAIPVTPADFAAFALDVPGVARALAFNLQDPTNPGVSSPGHVDIVAADENGEPLNPVLKAELVAYFNSVEAVLNVVKHVSDPPQITVDIAIALRLRPEADFDYVQPLAEQRIRDAFGGAWAFDTDAAGKWSLTPPTELTTWDVSALVDDLDGVIGVHLVTLNGGAGPVAVTAGQIVQVDEITVTQA